MRSKNKQKLKVKKSKFEQGIRFLKGLSAEWNDHVLNPVFAQDLIVLIPMQVDQKPNVLRLNN